MAIDSLIPALTRLENAVDAVDSSLWVHLPVNRDKRMLVDLTMGSVTASDLQEARANVGRLLSAVPRMHAMALENGAADTGAVATYQEAVEAIANLLQQRRPSKAPQRPLVTDTSRPPLPATLRGCSLDKMGIVRANNVEERCTARGFVKPAAERELDASKRRTTYVHADGCSVVHHWDTDELDVGWKGYGFAELGDLFKDGEWR